MGRFWERFYPFLISLFFVILMLYLNIGPAVKGFEKVLDGVITFSSIVVGFLGALLAVIMSLSKSEVIKHLYDYKLEERNGEGKGKVLFFVYCYQAISSGFITVLFSIFMYVIKELSSSSWYITYIFGLWMFITIFFITSSFRIINILMIVLSQEAKTNSPDRQPKKQKTKLSKEQLIELERVGAEKRK